MDTDLGSYLRRHRSSAFYSLDRYLTAHGPTTYRIAQCCCGLIIAVRALLAPARPDIVACVLVALLLLGHIVRSIGGDLAGAISLPLISLYPQLIGIPGSQAIRLLCLACLVWLLVTRDWTRTTNRIAFCVALAVIVVLGSLGGLSFLALSPVIALAWLLQRYVPADALRPYRTLWQAGAKASRILVIVTCIALLLLLLYGFTATDLLRSGNLFVQYLGFQSAPTVFSISRNPRILRVARGGYGPQSNLAMASRSR